jgi:hypothetical protein
MADHYLQICEYILQVFPEMASKQNHETNKMLIHHVCSRGTKRFGEGMLKACITAHFHSVATIDQSGALPIHWLMKNPNATINMLTALLLTHPAGVQVSEVLHKAVLCPNTM